MTDYISKTDLLLALAELPQEASKREVLAVVYNMKTYTELPLDGLIEFDPDPSHHHNGFLDLEDFE